MKSFYYAIIVVVGVNALTTHQTPPSPSTAPPCQTDLDGEYQFPHLVITIDSSNPTATSGTQYFATITPTISTIFNFDIPESYAGQNCSMIFLFPEQSQLTTSSFTFSGSGAIAFMYLKDVATESTNFDNAGPVHFEFGVTTVAPGNVYTITTGSCPAGDRLSFELQAVGDTELTFFQDSSPAPIGLYVTTC